jgi:hypothetical protein
MMRRSAYGLVIALAAAAGGCDGKVNDELVGKWKPGLVQAGPSGGVWQLKSDGTFSIEGGQVPSLVGSGKMVPAFPLWGKWSEKDGTLTLKYENGVPKLDNAEFRWKKAGGELQLTRTGQTVQGVVLTRADQ